MKNVYKKILFLGSLLIGANLSAGQSYPSRSTILLTYASGLCLYCCSNSLDTHEYSDNIDFLIESIKNGSVDPNAPYDDGLTLLHEAVTRSTHPLQLELCQALIDAGANVNAVENQFKLTPLQLALRFPGPHLKALCIMLIKAKTDLEIAKSSSEATALHDATRLGNHELVEILCKYGANINAQRTYKRTALHDAAEGDNLLAIEVLCKHGADPTKLDGGFNTPAQLSSLQEIKDHLALVEQTYQDYAESPCSIGPWFVPPQHLLKRAYCGAAPLEVHAGNSIYLLDLNTIYKNYIQTGNIKELKALLKQCNFDKLTQKQKTALLKIGFPLKLAELDNQNGLRDKITTEELPFCDVFIRTQN